ncbi:MAG: hypothetical protein GY828_00555, partial [Candidatus Gracilibacteria bacterium]|nr:hypothetical protein [Candidatus Gracilibacteria bacterium]
TYSKNKFREGWERFSVLTSGMILLTIPVTFFVNFIDPYVQKIGEITVIKNIITTINSQLVFLGNSFWNFYQDHINIKVIVEYVVYLFLFSMFCFLLWKWWKKDIDFAYILRLLLFTGFIGGAIWYIYNALVLGKSIFI